LDDDKDIVDKGRRVIVSGIDEHVIAGTSAALERRTDLVVGSEEWSVENCTRRDGLDAKDDTRAFAAVSERQVLIANAQAVVIEPVCALMLRTGRREAE